MNGGLPKTAVITGAGSGIGRAVALALAREGWSIGILDIDLAAAEETARLVKAAGGRAEVRRCDVRSLEEVEAAADHFFELFGEVGLLMNNAGIAGGGRVGTIRMDDWETVLAIDYWGVVYGCHAFIPRMKEQGAGHIVNTASIAGLFSLPEAAPYNTSKAAVVALSQTLRVELAPSNIGVTVLCPSVVPTRIKEKSFEMTCTTDYLDPWNVHMMERAFEGSRVTPGDVAGIVLEAMHRNRMFALTNPVSRITWFLARFSPSGFYRLFALLHRRGLARRLVLFIARRGYA